jgi:hypothetical protein
MVITEHFSFYEHKSFSQQKKISEISKKELLGESVGSVTASQSSDRFCKELKFLLTTKAVYLHATYACLQQRYALRTFSLSLHRIIQL